MFIGGCALQRGLQLGFLALLFFSLTLSFPKLPGEPEWKGIQLSASLLESRLESCDKSAAHRKGCNEAIRYLQGQLRSADKKSDQSYASLLALLKRQKRPQSEWVAGALNAWLSAFDPHAQITPAEQSDRQSADNHIQVKGLGVKLRIYRERALVAYVLEGSGAERSGLRSGDEILSLNGVKTRQLSRQEKENLFRAAKAPFRLELRRGAETIALEAEERRLSLPNVEWRVRLSENGVREGVVRVRSFNKDSACAEIKSALASLESREIERVELDLRDNPGGLVREAQCAAGLFLGPGKLFARMEKSAAADLLPASPAGYSRAEEKEFNLFTDQDRVTDKPLLVRINQNTASAAEMLAAALQDDKRARLAGARSFGKGSMQSVFHPWDDERLYLTRTTHRILRPSGKGLDLSGVTPDIITERAEGADFPREADLTR